MLFQQFIPDEDNRVGNLFEIGLNKEGIKSSVEKDDKGRKVKHRTGT